MEYEQTNHSAHVASEEIRRHFNNEERRKKNTRLMFIVGLALCIAVTVAIILADLGIF
jgi:predicted nucleic acid-binding Zn ribbon protein